MSSRPEWFIQKRVTFSTPRSLLPAFAKIFFQLKASSSIKQNNKKVLFQQIGASSQV